MPTFTTTGIRTGLALDNPLVTIAILALSGYVGLKSAVALKLNFEPPPGWRLPIGEVWLFVWLLFGIAMAALTGRFVS